MREGGLSEWGGAGLWQIPAQMSGLAKEAPATLVASRRNHRKIRYRAPSGRDFFGLFKAVMISIINLFCVQLFNLIFRDLNFLRAFYMGSKRAPRVLGGLEGMGEVRKERCGAYG